jgi:predicted DNA-binding protein with PD1-like motif
MRTLTQPGPAEEPRRISREASDAGQFRIVLPAGADLLTDATRILVQSGIDNAAIQLAGGGFSTMQYLTGQADDSGARVATYGAPTTLDGPVEVVGGNAILGRDAEGAPILHCHAVVVDREGGLHGGHLPPKVCIAGPEGIVLLVTAVSCGGFRVAYDAETNYSIFQPAEA